LDWTETPKPSQLGTPVSVLGTATNTTSTIGFHGHLAWAELP
jgi:hypothetical protein